MIDAQYKPARKGSKNTSRKFHSEGTLGKPPLRKEKPASKKLLPRDQRKATNGFQLYVNRHSGAGKKLKDHSNKWKEIGYDEQMVRLMNYFDL
jgi:hypothetical protein